MFGVCKPECCGSDPVADRVKVDHAALALAIDKENSPPVASLDKLAVQHRKEEEHAATKRKQAEFEEAERRRAAAEAAAKADAERLLKESLEKELLENERLEWERMEQELLEQERLKQERLEQERLEKERLEKERLEKERQEEEARQAALRQQQAAAELAERERAADEAAKLKVNAFLKDNKLDGVNAKKSSLMPPSSKYPLHIAVEKKDSELVRALLRCKADPSLLNSSKKNAEQLARSSNRKGSHDQVLDILMGRAK